MEIAVELYFTAFQSFSYHLFYRKALRKKLGAGVRILTIEIMGAQAAPIVADYDAVRV